MMKKILKRTSAALLGASLMLTTVVPVIHAEEQSPPLSSSVRNLDVETLVEGEKYGIYPTTWYDADFNKVISVDKVNELLALTEKKIASLGLAENKKYKPVKVKNDNTRGDIVKRLYNIVARYDLPVGTDAIKFMKDHNILQGYSNELKLEHKATTQQAVLLASRLIKITYELAEQGGKGIAWVVEDEDTTVYLLGSIHLGTPDLYPFDQKLVKAFDKADALLVEANILDTKGLDYYAKKAMYSDGTTLKDAVAPETYAKLEKVAKLYNLPMEQLKLQKPWTLSSTLAMLSTDNSFGMTPQEMAMHGIDMYFLLNAQLQQKPVIELEGMKAQVDMFDALSQETQEQSLVAVLDNIINPSEENQSNILQEWFTSWKQGNVEEFAKSFQSMEGGPSEYNEMLFGLRDEQMAKKIMNVLKEKKGTYFVVVGSGHFLGEKSIRYHLEKDGYKVKPFYQ